MGFWPTPLHFLPGLSEAFPDYQIYIKRDDQTGLALGGNKTRKLEYLLYQAIRQDCDTIVTAGAAQSNHCRQTAAAAVSLGLECHLVLGGRPPESANGNLLIDQLLGAQIHWTGEGGRAQAMEKLAQNLAREGRKPFVIPIGGSNALGCLGYVKAVGELKDQLTEMGLGIDHIFFASSSGGTQAGLIVGKRLFRLEAQLTGISVDKSSCWDIPLEDHILMLANQAAQALGMKHTFGSQDLDLDRGYDASGYGVVTSSEVEAIGFVAKTEGIILDPVYTGRAMAGLLDKLRRRMLPPGSKILFWHTGGAPALFHYGQELVEDR